ncbi:MAG: lipopolysaccharide heptosyltransferase II [Candidatus Omnitrophota bacterium]
MHRILIINPFGIGDCLFTTPLISSIKQQWPDSYLGYWCNERVSELLKQNPKIDIVFPLSRGDIKRLYGNLPFAQLKNIFRLFSQIRKTNFDIALDFSLDHRYGLLSKLAGVKKRIGFDYKNRGRFLTQKRKISGYQDRHIVEYYFQLLRFLQIEPMVKRLELFVSESFRSWTQEFLRENHIDAEIKIIGICPGAGESWGKDAIFKRWDVERFAQVCNKLIENLKVKILIFGNKQDEEACQKVYRTILKKEEVLKIYPDFTLSQFAALLSKCSLLITNDGGPLHMAVALGVKTVSIFGPVSEIVYGPYPASKEHIVVKTDYDCQPCYKNFRFPKCENGQRCMIDIKPEEVFQAARSLL